MPLSLLVARRETGILVWGGVTQDGIRSSLVLGYYRVIPTGLCELRREGGKNVGFMNGKQKRVRRPPPIGGIDVDEFIRRNADPIWLHQNQLWEYMDQADES